MDPLFRWIALGVGLVCAPFWMIGLWEARDVGQQLARGEQVSGTVVGNRQTVDHRDGIEEHAYQPEVRFRARDGSERRFTDGVGSLPPDFAVGETVTVLYAPSTPSRARVVTWKRLWLAPTIFIIVGLLPALVTWLVLARVSRSRPA
jgi:hypothetical protein